MIERCLTFEQVDTRLKNSCAKTNFSLVFVQKLMNIDFFIKNGFTHTNDFPKKHVNHVIDPKNPLILKRSKLSFFRKDYSICFYR